MAYRLRAEGVYGNHLQAVAELYNNCETAEVKSYQH